MESFAAVCSAWLDKMPCAEVEKRDGDYCDDEGMIVCGVCGKRRETIIRVELPSGTREKHVACACDCVSKAIRDAREEAKKKILVGEMMRYSIVDDRFETSTFANWQVTSTNAKYKGVCERYVEHFDELYQRGVGMLLWGETGIGKTYMSSCIAHALLDEKRSVVVTSVLRLISRGFDAQGDVDELIERMSAVDVLILDDFGVERDTDYKLEQIYAIIDARYATKKPMIISTNLTLKEMKETTDIRKKRIYERILEVCHPVHVECENMRKEQAKKRYYDVEALLST